MLRSRAASTHLALLLVLLVLAGCIPASTSPIATVVAPAPSSVVPLVGTRVPFPTATRLVPPTRTPGLAASTPVPTMHAPIPPGARATATRATATRPSVPPGATVAQLVKIIDGDTIDVSFAGATERVRYIGVDTPERGQPGFKLATEANRRLLGAGPLYLVRDVSDRDRTADRRLLRYVYTSDGTLVEAELVRGGWAQPVEYPPDTKYAARLRELAVQAAREKRGFWSATPPPGGAMPYGLTTGPAEVRKGPGTTFGVSAALPADTPLTVYGRTPAGDWLQVRTPERKGGWISARSVRLNVPVELVPVPAEIPTPEG